MTIKKLYIVAYNIRHGGGAILLLELLSALKHYEKINITILVSSELDIPFPLNANVQIKSIKEDLLSRLAAEFYLKFSARPKDTFLFFGNFPPLFKLSGKVFVYMQNRILVDTISQSVSEGNLGQKIKLFIQKKWLTTQAKNTDVFLVQSISIKNLLKSKLRANFPVIQLPFSRSIMSLSGSAKKKLSNDPFEFIYVALGYKHKNHTRLILAWEALAKEGIYPILHLTLSEKNDLELLSKLSVIKASRKLLIENHSDYSHDNIIKLYKKSDALIYPSLIESLGLPLIEAKQLGIPIIASELDYVRDLIDPEFTFNPESELSIARAVKRFMGLKSEKIIMKSANDILDHLMTNGSQKLK